MDRVTIKHLRAQCAYLNRITNSPPEPWVQVDGKNVAQIGCYIIDQAYSGYQLARIMNEGGGQTSPLGLGFTPARDLLARMRAYIAGLEQRP